MIVILLIDVIDEILSDLAIDGNRGAIDDLFDVLDSNAENFREVINVRYLNIAADAKGKVDCPRLVCRRCVEVIRASAIRIHELLMPTRFSGLLDV